MRAVSACDVLGIAPHRQMIASRAAHAHTMARIDRALAAMHHAGRRAILIVDTKCGDGSVLIRAARRASARGFLAVEARGFDRRPALVAEARNTARDVADPRIGFDFALRRGPGPAALDDEADLVLADPDEDPPATLRGLLTRSGTIIDHW